MDWLTSKKWKEVEVGIANEYEIAVPGSLKAQRKQYGLKHHFTSTVHTCQGDTLHRIATEVSYGNSLYKLWDCGQVVVILSRTNFAKDVIFVGDKKETIKCLVALIQVKTQYMDYMECNGSRNVYHPQNIIYNSL